MGGEETLLESFLDMALICGPGFSGKFCITGPNLRARGGPNLRARPGPNLRARVLFLFLSRSTAPRSSWNVVPSHLR